MTMEMVHHFKSHEDAPAWNPEPVKQVIQIGNNPDINPDVAPREAPPSFPPRIWHNPLRLDGRAVRWSLDNRPHEWVRVTGSLSDRLLLKHTPSNHTFAFERVGEFFPNLMTAYLYAANCGCHTATERKFQRFQHFGLYRAAKRWCLAQLTPNGWKQFEGHFTSPKV